jgi:hypothetical protein
VAYATPPEFPTAEGEVLLCCARPAREGGDVIVLDL